MTRLGLLTKSAQALSLARHYHNPQYAATSLEQFGHEKTCKTFSRDRESNGLQLELGRGLCVNLLCQHRGLSILTSKGKPAASTLAAPAADQVVTGWVPPVMLSSPEMLMTREGINQRKSLSTSIKARAPSPCCRRTALMPSRLHKKANSRTLGTYHHTELTEIVTEMYLHVSLAQKPDIPTHQSPNSECRSTNAPHRLQVQARTDRICIIFTTTTKMAQLLQTGRSS